ncbi:hypothetical protein AN958_04137 [Leucoagaricus sp. SymC.cos]|nr:hypothetical protein AN958_04137 [Leucoagaricus sp. SymC.cos]
MESIHPFPPVSASSVPSFPRASLSVPRDMSVPHSRPPFRMRTSLTPQPAQLQRERSEPPPLQMLRANPTFVKPPPLEEGSRAGSNEPGPTLGSLVDSVRRTQSPARQQHSSLLFGGKTQVEPKPELSRSQKALHELEIYKTPLLPTRLRNGPGQSSITGVPDLFRPRRKLLLMKDEGRTSDRKLGRKETVSPDKNGTKPYAGEASDSGGSSLRVGRAKSSRNHISRPAARSRAKFSAAFDEEPDDAMVDEDKERQMLEEAAKKAPVFNIPTDFSFAENVKPIEHDTTNAREPPIKSLPFSFTVPKAPAAPGPEKTEVPIPQPFQPPPTTTLPFSFESTPAAPAVTQDKPPSLFGAPSTATTNPSAGAPVSSSGVPNFFARSAAFNKPLDVKTPPFANGTPSVNSSATSLFNSPAPTAPVKDTANPLWDGDKKTSDGGLLAKLKNDEPRSSTASIFSTAAQEKSVEEPKTSAPTHSLFGDPSKASASAANIFSTSSAKPTEASSLFGAQPAGVNSTNNTGFTPSASGSVFGGSATDTTTKPTTSLFGTTPKSAPEVEKPAGTFGTTPSAPTTSFAFGQATTAPTSSVEAPKPATSDGSVPFGNALPAEAKAPSPIPFIFGNQSKETKPASLALFGGFGTSDKETRPGSPAPFNFGAPSTPVAAEKTTPFIFGTPSASPAPPSIFTFGAGGSTTSDVSKPLQIDRPVTPPKNNEQEFKMEESPTREVQQANGANKLPAFTGFSFGNPPSTTSVLFGGPTSAPPATTTPFPFGSNSSSNPFAAPPPIKESKSEGPKPFSFGQSASPAPTTSTGFTFGQTAQTGGESPRPSTTGSFGFGPGTPTSTTSGFNFGQAPASNPFAQQSSGSAPSSPSTFQSSAFNFGATTSGTTPFTFGSQPASPATGATNLPQASTPVTFGSGNTGFGSSAPSSPFSAPTQIAASTSSGGTLFTIGAAPPPQPGTQGRAIKKLPNRNRKR